MKKTVRAFEIVGVVVCYISVAALLIMVGITVADIFLKQIFSSPITGAVEITRMMMVCTAPAFVSALFKNRHVRVGLFIDRLGKKWQLAFDTFGYLLSAGLCGLMCYQGFIEVNKKMVQKQVYTMLRLPTWPFYAIFAVAMGILALGILVRLVDMYFDVCKPVPYEIGSSGGADL